MNNRITISHLPQPQFEENFQPQFATPDQTTEPAAADPPVQVAPVVPHADVFWPDPIVPIHVVHDNKYTQEREYRTDYLGIT